MTRKAFYIWFGWILAVGGITILTLIQKLKKL